MITGHKVFCLQLMTLLVKLFSTIIMFVFSPIWIVPFTLISPNYFILAAIGSTDWIENVSMISFVISLALFATAIVLGIICVKFKRIKKSFNVLFAIFSVFELIASFLISNVCLKAMCILVSFCPMIISVCSFKMETGKPKKTERG